MPHFHARLCAKPATDIVWWEEYTRVSYSLTVLKFFLENYITLFSQIRVKRHLHSVGSLVRFVLFCEILSVPVALAGTW